MLMESSRSVWAGLLLLTATLVALALARPGKKPGAHQAAPSAPTAAPVVAAGLKVQIDPVTHRIVPPPAKLAPDPAAQQLFNSSHEGLVEVPGTTAAGGFKVDLQGRFQSAVTVSVGPDGKPVFHHVDGPAAAQPVR